MSKGTSSEEQSADEPGFSNPYMKIVETAELLRCDPKTIRNKMSAGVYQEGWHFIRPPHSQPLFIRARVDPLAQVEAPSSQLEPIPMARTNGKVVLPRLAGGRYR